jgi:hypothetical protein
MFMRTPLALLPPDEGQRLASVRHYGVQNLAPDDALHDLLALTAHAFGLPVSFLALVDEHEVRFPARYGGPPMASVPRAEALCSSAILHPHAVAYENLATASLTGADGPAIRAARAQGAGCYAAAPLRMPDGRTIGALCLLGLHPRPFNGAEQEALASLADVASLAVAVRCLCLGTPELGAREWRRVGQQLRHDVLALRALLDTLVAPRETQAPVAPAVLQALQRRLPGLRLALAE